MGLSSPPPQAPDGDQTSLELRGAWNPPSWGSGRPLTGWSPSTDSGGEVSKAAIAAWRTPGMGAGVGPVPPRRQGSPKSRPEHAGTWAQGLKVPLGMESAAPGIWSTRGRTRPPGGPPGRGQALGPLPASVPGRSRLPRPPPRRCRPRPPPAPPPSSRSGSPPPRSAPPRARLRRRGRHLARFRVALGMDLPATVA